MNNLQEREKVKTKKRKLKYVQQAGDIAHLFWYRWCLCGWLISCFYDMSARVAVVRLHKYRRQQVPALPCHAYMWVASSNCLHQSLTLRDHGETLLFDSRHYWKKLFFLLEIRSLFCRGDSDYYMISDMLCLLQACNENVFFFRRQIFGQTLK